MAPQTGEKTIFYCTVYCTVNNAGKIHPSVKFFDFEVENYFQDILNKIRP
jgi:hypothetical protein